MLSIAAEDVAGTRQVGARLAASIVGADLTPVLVIALTGELGAGKTTLVAGLLAALGHPGPVRSPTYTLIEPYQLAGREIAHCDLYRLRAAEELDELGLEDLAVDRGLLLIEWPERAGDRLPAVDLRVAIGYAGTGRRVEIDPLTDAGRRIAAGMGLDGF